MSRLKIIPTIAAVASVTTALVYSAELNPPMGGFPISVEEITKTYTLPVVKGCMDRFRKRIDIHHDGIISFATDKDHKIRCNQTDSITCSYWYKRPIESGATSAITVSTYKGKSTILTQPNFPNRELLKKTKEYATKACNL